MKRIAHLGLVAAGLLALPASAAAAGPPPTPVPTSLTISKVNSNLVVKVKVKNLTKSDAGQVGLDLYTFNPKKHFAVHQNGPGLPYTVNPIPGHPAGQSTGKAKVTLGTGTMTFKFALKAIGSPHKLRLRAINQGSQGTKFSVFITSFA